MDRTRQLGIPLAALAACVLVGCDMHVESVSRQSFRLKGRVAILGQLSRDQMELFIPLYMKAFPHQALVERQDLDTVLNEQDLPADRLRPETLGAIPHPMLDLQPSVVLRATGPCLIPPND